MANLFAASETFKKNFADKILFYRAHPVIAGIQLLECDFPPVQRVILRELFNVNYQITTASRGIGKTYLAGVQALLTAILVPNSKILLTGPTFRSAKFIFTEAENILKKSTRAQIWMKGGPSHLADIWTLRFINGSIIVAMPLASESESSIRGFRAHLILADEIPHIPESTFNTVLLPMLSTVRDPMYHVRRIEKMKRLIKLGKAKHEDMMIEGTNKLFGFTSAWYKFNHVYKKIEEFEKLRTERLEAKMSPLAQTFYFSYLDAAPGFIDSNMLDLSKRTMADFQFRMEWLSEWQSDSNGFYSRRLIDECVARSHYLPLMHGDRAHAYVMGIDPARTHDTFAICIAKEDNGIFKVVRVVSFKNKEFPFVLKEVRQLFREFPNIVRVFMDDGGGGLAFRDLLASRDFLGAEESPIIDMDDELFRDRAGKKILHMVRFTPEVSTEFNFSFKAAMEKEIVLFPVSAPEGSIYIRSEAVDSDQKDMMLVEVFKMLNELQSIMVTATSTGRLRFDGPKKESEIDRFTALLLAWAAYKETFMSQAAVVELPGGNWIEDIGNLNGNNEEDDWTGEGNETSEEVVWAER